MEKVCGARDEGSRVELGPGRKAGSGQSKMVFLGVGLMCEHARRGLSIVSMFTISPVSGKNNGILSCDSLQSSRSYGHNAYDTAPYIQ